MAAHQAPLSLGFSRQEHWSGLPVPSPLILKNSYSTDSKENLGKAWTYWRRLEQWWFWFWIIWWLREATPFLSASFASACFVLLISFQRARITRRGVFVAWVHGHVDCRKERGCLQTFAHASGQTVSHAFPNLITRRREHRANTELDFQDRSFLELEVYSLYTWLGSTGEWNRQSSVSKEE